MSMNVDDLRAVVEYVRNNSGCTMQQIATALPSVSNLVALLEEASSGARADDGCILKLEEGRYYLGPQSHLVYGE